MAFRNDAALAVFFFVLFSAMQDPFGLLPPDDTPDTSLLPLM